LGGLTRRKPIEIWVQDEARIGQKNGLVRQGARRGTRPRQPADQRSESAYLFGAICPARGTGAALAQPYADTHAMQLHLDEIARTVRRGAHAVLRLDRAGWHTTAALAVANNITMILLPSRAPELNPVENVWPYLRQTWLSPRVFDTYEDVVDAACEAWRKLIAQPQTITSIGTRQWALTGQSAGRWYQPHLSRLLQLEAHRRAGRDVEPHPRALSRSNCKAGFASKKR
jgi:putative transposase